MTKNKWKTVAYLLILMMTGILIYANSVNAPFQFDSEIRIENNPAIHMVDFNLESLKKAILENPSKTRLIPFITFTFNYYFGRLSPVGYHWVNIIIHIFCAGLLFIFCRETLLLCAKFNKTGSQGVDYNISTFHPDHNAASLIAFFAALLWLSHPVNTSAVTYTIQRVTSLAALFYILSLICYIKGRNRQQTTGSLTRRALIWFAGAVLSAICAVITKQNAAMLPLFILLYEWIFFQQLKPIKLKKLLVLATPFAILFTAAVFYYMPGNPADIIINWYGRLDFTLPQRLLTQSRVVIFYISLFFFPVSARLNLDYDYPLSQLTINPFTTIFALAAIIAITGIAIYRPRQQSLMLFTVLWFFGNLVIESTVIPLAMIYEHRTYLPFMLLCLMVSFYAYLLLKKNMGVYIGILVLALLAFGLETYQRNAEWQDPVNFARDVAIKSPHKFRPQYNLGKNLVDQGRIDEATEALRKALTMNPKKPNPVLKKAHNYNMLGIALMQRNSPEEAVENFSKALRLKPDYKEGHLNIARAMLKQKRPRTAIRRLNAYLSKHPESAEANSLIGRAYVELNDAAKALPHFKKALEASPNQKKVHNSLGNMLAKQGQTKKAISHFQRAIRIDPGFEKAYSNLGNAYAQSGQFHEAIANYKKALSINPNYKMARENLKKVKTHMEKNR